MLAWGTAISAAASYFADLDNKSYLEVTYKQQHVEGYGMFQFWYANWSNKIKIYVDGKEFDSDFTPGDYYNTPDGTEHVTQFAFDAATFTQIQKLDVLFQGNGIVVTKVELKAPETSGIHDATIKREAGDAIYNLQGQRISKPRKGLYIQNGKKLMAQ